MTPSAELGLTESVRFRLARHARDAALSVPGVRGTDAGAARLIVTAEAGEKVEGVLCVASGSGAYNVSLRLVCDLVPLRPLAERVHTQVQRVARTHGIALDEVSVHIADIAPQARP